MGIFSRFDRNRSLARKIYNNAKETEQTKAPKTVPILFWDYFMEKSKKTKKKWIIIGFSGGYTL